MTTTNPLGYKLAQISTASHQEDPHRLGRIYLDSEAGGEWVDRQLVFVGYPTNLAPLIKHNDDSSHEISNKDLVLPPVGTYVVVLEPIEQT